MNLETFYEQFELLADAPNAVSKLREMVLRLAVRGKLVEQSDSDNSVKGLQEEIAGVRSKAGQSSRRRKTAEYEVARLAYVSELPNTWTTISLGEVTDIIRGITFPASEKSKEPAAGKIACLRTTNVQSNVEWHDLLFVPEHRVKNASQMIRPNDILISMANSYELVGKVAQVKEIPVQATFGGFIAAIRPIVIDSNYLLYYLRSPESQAEMRTSSSQTTNIANISLGRLNPMAVPLPPLEEQKRIVAKVDELMALCDDLETQQQARAAARSRLNTVALGRLSSATDEAIFKQAWARVGSAFDTLYSTPKTMAELRKTVLQLAVQGKLVRQDPEDEPAEKLLERITVVKERLVSEGKVRNLKPLPPIAKDEVPFALPSNWIWTRLLWVAEAIDPNPSHRMPKYVASGIPFVSTENFGDNDALNFDVGKKVEQATLSAQIERFEVLEGAFAFSRIGSIGKTRPLPMKRGYCLSHALSVISPFSTDINPIYLRNAMITDAVLNQAKKEVKSIGVPDLGMGSIRSFLIPLPPSDEQERIVAKVDELMALVDELEAGLLQARGDSARLLGAVIQSLLSSEIKQPVEA